MLVRELIEVCNQDCPIFLWFDDGRAGGGDIYPETAEEFYGDEEILEISVGYMGDSARLVICCR